MLRRNPNVLPKAEVSNRDVKRALRTDLSVLRIGDVRGETLPFFVVGVAQDLDLALGEFVLVLQRHRHLELALETGVARLRQRQLVLIHDPLAKIVVDPDEDARTPKIIESIFEMLVISDFLGAQF